MASQSASTGDMRRSGMGSAGAKAAEMVVATVAVVMEEEATAGAMVAVA